MKKNTRDIMAVKKQISSFVEDVKSGKATIGKRKTLRNELDLIKNELVELKNTGLSVLTIHKLLVEKFGYNITYQSLAVYFRSIRGGDEKGSVKAAAPAQKNVKELFSGQFEFK